MINAAINSPECKQYWAKPGWLPAEIGVTIDNGKLFCFQGDDLRLHLQKGHHVVKVYELVGIVADINSGEHQKPHLVSLVNSEFSTIAAASVAHFLQHLYPNEKQTITTIGTYSTTSW